MCDACADFLTLLETYDARISSKDAKHSVLLKNEIETAFSYIQSWPTRQCMCLYRDPKNFERFNLLVQSMICLTVHQLKNIDKLIEDYKDLVSGLQQTSAGQQRQRSSSPEQQRLEKAESPETQGARTESNNKITKDLTHKESTCDTANSPKSTKVSSNFNSHFTEETWILPEVEKLLILDAKVFLMNFPLYVAYKHGTHARLDDISAEEAQHLSIFCDLHDNEIPVFLLRNISLFCSSGGFAAMMLCFEHPNLPVSTAQAITALVSNVKLWLNYGCIVQLFVPLRSRVLQYMCKLSDQNLRMAATRAMADFVWSSVRDPLDAAVSFDIEGLALAFKYFTSTTLTMRLAGMAQINAHINLFNEICTTEPVGDVEIVGQKIANWLTENHIIQHLFGPNLHVEVIKQAHIVLNFLAVENKITEEDVKLIWQATQLKHCSKTIYDILPSLTKNLSPRLTLHLYQLLNRMDPKDHTEQSIYIASGLTKLIWSRDTTSQISLMHDHLFPVNVTASSSDSGSIDGSNSYDEQGAADDSSLASGGRKSPIDIETVGSDSGANSIKQQRRVRHHVCDTIEDNSKQLNEDELMNQNEIKLQNHRLVNIIDNSSSDDDLQHSSIEMHRKKTCKRRKNNSLPLTRLAHEIVEAIWDGGEEDDGSSDDADEADAEILNDSDDCSETGQVMPSAVLKHLQGEGPYIRAIAETHISELLSGAENDNSYSSPMSNKSEKNLADFDDEDVSPCEEELAELVSTRVPHNCVPSAFAAAAVAMAAAHSAMQMQKTDPNVAAAAAAVAAAAVATGNAQQSFEAMRQQANVVAVAAAKAASLANTKSTDSCIDVNISPKASPEIFTLKVNDVCKPGNTLLWDLLQDDKIGQLSESLALEAEKALANLVCFNLDRFLRTKFIEGCLQNLAANRSVVVSLRLLPKLFASFTQYRPSYTHQVTMWAERQHKMMYHFFNNIKFYAKQYAEQLASGITKPSEAPAYTHKTQVSVRLQFLSSIFSSQGSPKSFRLSIDQVDSLWEWLAHDTECADCYFSWLHSQAKGGDQHALGIEALQHLYIKKLPELRPEEFSMVALGLFQQLCSLARMVIAQYEKHTDSISTNSSNIVGMYHLWKIALRAYNTDVSLAAIQYINMFYMGQQLRLEKEFVSQCMDQLVQAANALENSEDENALMCVQRGLMLLNTHLETFRRRYAFHLRRWAIEGKGIGSHSNLKNEGSSPTIRIVLQPAGLSEKSVLHMQACDLIAELKAEISKWWETLQDLTASGVTAPVLGLLLSEGPLRIITQGQELTPDYDERTLGDAGFKDNQIVYVSLGGRGARRKDTNIDHPSMQPPPPKECLPTVILLQPKYFEKLFCLMQTLGDMKPLTNNMQLYTKAQVLSRRVWDILAVLPTNPLILDAFKSIIEDINLIERLANKEEQTLRRLEVYKKITDLLDPSNLQKFMYSLHIVESLVLNCVYNNRSSNRNSPCCDNVNGNFKGAEITEAECNEKTPANQKKNKKFVKKDESFSSTEDIVNKMNEEDNEEHIKKSTKKTAVEQSDGGDEALSSEQENSPVKKKYKRVDRCDSMQTDGDGDGDGDADRGSTNTIIYDTKWSDAFIKAGGLKHLYNIFISGNLQQSAYPQELMNEWRHDCLASLLRILWLLGFEEVQAEDMHMLFSRPHAFMLELMEVKPCLHRLSTILNDETYHNYMTTSTHFPFQYHNLRTGFWGRPQIVQFAMNIIVSFVHASEEAMHLLWSKEEYSEWVLKFILEDPEPMVRREICAGLYRICLGNALNYKELLAPLLRKLISFLPVAEKMTTFAQQTPYLLSDEGKEPYGPACRDYFWLLSRLVDTITPEMMKSSLQCPENADEAIDIEVLCQSVSQSILTRDFYETRYGMQDDGLIGLINLMCNLVKYDPSFKFSNNAVAFIDKIFIFLFDMPSPDNRKKPKCKSGTSRAATYDLLVEMCKSCHKNYIFLHNKLLAQHTPGPKAPYQWDYWPRDEGRSECGYVGLTNLGATCYMASCIQHLYMMPQARNTILRVQANCAQKHGPTLLELQRMFAYLLESERKSYNPRSFCRVYQMDHQPLNTGEQKDMAEFFIDLVSKLEEMTPELKHLVKRLFCGTLSNNVVSLDCGHVSRTAEEFYTVRCQVADMRNLQESLDEVTVKDTLEGDNMYTCSQCGKKVRAEKRACFKKLPQILCFNTMRYTFNMVTMLKEKVNTHFSFPVRLNMSDYVEKTLMPDQYKEDREKKLQERAKNVKCDRGAVGHGNGNGDGNSNCDNNSNANANGELNEQNLNSFEDEIEECFEYELVGVTVHTGTADGGHYYSFIKERTKSVMQHDRWFLFNDAEVKPFDPSQIGAECFGGEMTSKTYDSVTEKYLDFSFEKTNSAYMLFYERRLPEHLMKREAEKLESFFTDKHSMTLSTVNSAKSNPPSGDEEDKQITEEINVIKTECDAKASTSAAAAANVITKTTTRQSLLNKELEDWIWQDNKQFLQDRYIFEHTYFNFMWQICGHIPQTLIAQSDVTCIAAKLSVSFFIETFIHAKEKPTMVPWVELLTKQFNASQDACEWFLTHMSIEPWWPVQVLIQCPNQMVRQMFQRLVIHVIQRLRASHVHLYLKTETDNDGKEIVGKSSCVTRFITSLILLMEHGAKAHLRHLSEFFSLLFEFSRMGEEETMFLLQTNVIKSVADFYLGHKTQDSVDVSSDNDENSSDEALPIDKTRPASLDKMIALVSNLVERSRGQDLRLRLSAKDYNAIAGGKNFPFLYQQIKDNINPHQTKLLIHALCRWDERLAVQVIAMLFNSITKHTELCGSFFKLLTLLTETSNSSTGLPCFSQLVLQRVWDAAEYCPQSALDWLAYQVPKNKIAHNWVLQTTDNWVESFLLAHNNTRVRNAAAFLLVSLVPSQSFRANFRTHSLHKLSSQVTRELSSDAQNILHNIINLLLRLLRPARAYADIGVHGTTKLAAYFSLLSYCMVSKAEKLMIGPYMRSLWDLFHPRLSEPSVPAHHNKHALLAFWHHTIVDCPENALLVANCPEITRNIAFNYILADHDDSEIVSYNRAMLPVYYGLLRLCCEQSRALTRQLAAHQNLQWAFKNITPHPTQYASAVDELFKLMSLFAKRHPDASEQEKHEVTTFRRTTLSSYLTSLDARVSWGTLINALKILVDNDEDRLLVIYNGGIEMCFEALHTLHSMHHEATACHVAGDLQELLTELVLLLTTLRLSTCVESATQKKQQLQQYEQQAHQLQQQHQELLQKHQEQLKQQQSQLSQQTQQQKEKQLQQHMQQHLQLQQMQQQLQQQHFLRQQHHHAGLVKGLPDAVKRLATLLNTFNPPEICRFALEALKELVRNPNLDISTVLAPVLINCHLTAANTPSAIGQLGPYFPRSNKVPWPAICKSTPRPPRPMVQMCIPHKELVQKGTFSEYDAQIETFYRPYHDFIDIMMRMAVNTNQLNDTLVKLSCLVAIEAAPLHFNLFPKFWVGIYNNKSTNKYAELLINNQYLVEYIHTVMRDARISLSDPHIRSFLEIYYPKVAIQLPVARLLYTISYAMHEKDDLDDLCGDLFAIRVIAQSTGIPTCVRKQLTGSLKALLLKKSQLGAIGDRMLFPNKKQKMESNETEENQDSKVCKEILNRRAKSENEEDNDTNHEQDNKGSNESENMEKSILKSEDNKDCNVKLQDSEQFAATASTVAFAEIAVAPIANTSKSPEIPIKETIQNEPAQPAVTPTTNVTITTTTACTIKSTNKKTAEDRLNEEQEKRSKLLFVMETYIKSILTLMQKDEAGSNDCSAIESDCESDGVDQMDCTQSQKTNVKKLLVKPTQPHTELTADQMLTKATTITSSLSSSTLTSTSTSTSLSLSLSSSATKSIISNTATTTTTTTPAATITTTQKHDSASTININASTRTNTNTILERRNIEEEDEEEEEANENVNKNTNTIKDINNTVMQECSNTATASDNACATSPNIEERQSPQM